MTKSLRTASLLALLCSAAVAACAGSSAPAEDASNEPDLSPADAAGEAEVVAPEAAELEEPAETAQKSFDDMSPGEKMNHMKKVITPEMGQVFAKLDADEFGDFNCTVCHGPGAKQGDFAMPSASLPLNKEEMEEHPDVTIFMKEQVVPKMAELLGEAPYNPETGEGFGCFDCHTKAE